MHGEETRTTQDNIASIFRLLDETYEEEEYILQKRDTIMRMMAEVAGKTFEYEGQIYQVCERFNKKRGVKVPFFKKLAAWPKSWLDMQARAKRGLSQEEADPVIESAQVDVVSGTGGTYLLSDSTPNTADPLSAGATSVVVD